MLVLMENKNFSEVIGQGNQPFTNSLATKYGLATQSYAVNHPSLPNYIDIVSGHNPSNSTDDGPPSSHTYTYTTIADQLRAAGISEKAYAENLPSNPTSDSGAYAVRHFPWEYFPGSTAMPIADASTMVSNLNAATPPAFVWYTPNLTNDEHDGSVQQGDAFLSSFISRVQSTSWYRAGGQIIVTWDESSSDNTNGGGRVPTIVVSDNLRALPQKDSAQVNTTGILNSIEDSYGLSHLAAGTGTIDSLLSSGPSSNRSIRMPANATANAGKSFLFSISTTGSPTPKLKKKGHLPSGLHFRNNHDGTATIWGVPNPKKSIGSRQVTIVATFGKGKAKQVTTQVLTLTVSP
jgi:acid phosphatase